MSTTTTVDVVLLRRRRRRRRNRRWTDHPRLSRLDMTRLQLQPQPREGRARDSAPRDAEKPARSGVMVLNSVRCAIDSASCSTARPALGMVTLDTHRRLSTRAEKNQLKKIKLEIDNQKSRVDRYGRRVVRLEDFTKGQSSALNDKKNELFAVRPSLKNVIRTRINQLVTHIFSLNEVHPTILQNEGLDVSNNLSHALAEASKLTYVCGQWVDTCEEWSRQTELGYRIVAPTLPANGDYSAYNEWVSDKNRDYAFHQTFIEPNPACTISAALTYTSQLVKQISFFIDVFLPRRPNFSEFCGNELNETKFAKYVTHLNANILYLCFSQNVDPKLLHPDHTLKNLLQLLDTSVSDLGRVDPPDIDSKLCNAFEDKITFQLFSFTGDSDSEEDNYYEWEAVPNVEYLADQNQLSSQSASSVVRAGLVASTAASLASMWRGWTK